jgi:adenylate cyclase class IV
MMNTEFEAKILAIDIEQFRSRCKSLDAECIHPMRHMRRVVYDHPSQENCYFRIRDEGDRTTFTIKKEQNDA